MLSILNPINGAIGRNVQIDPEVAQALEHQDRPLPNLKGIKRFFFAVIELLVTFVISLLPIWETPAYVKVVYHSWFKNWIVNAHPKPEEIGEIVAEENQ